MEDDDSSSWFAWGAIAAAAVAGTALGRAGMATEGRATVADELTDGLVEHELHAAAAAEGRVAMLALMGRKEAGAQKKGPFDGEAFAKTLPGILEPTGFWDPLGFCSADDITEGKIRFYREVELKHGRVGAIGCAA